MDGFSALVGSLGPLLGVLVGFGLNEASHLFRMRVQDRRAIGPAIAALMEMRHHFLIVTKGLSEILKHLRVPSEYEAVLRPYFAQFIPGIQSSLSKYDETVDMVARFNPLLAFRLRSQDTLESELDKVRTLLSGDPSAAVAWFSVEAEIKSAIIPHYEELIRELAWNHGLSTWFRVRRRLERPFEPPRELQDFLDTCIQMASQASSPSPSTTEAQVGDSNRRPAPE